MSHHSGRTLPKLLPTVLWTTGWLMYAVSAVSSQPIKQVAGASTIGLSNHLVTCATTRLLRCLKERCPIRIYVAA